MRIRELLLTVYASGAKKGGLFLLTLLITAAPKTSSARELLFSSQVDPQEANQLIKDLSNDLTLLKGNDVKRTLQIRDLRDQTLKNWLFNRVGYVIGEDEDPADHLAVVQGQFSYSNPTAFPLFERPDIGARRNPAESAAAITPVRMSISMTNVGTSFYYMGKRKGVLVGYRFLSNQGEQVVSISSPRAGIIKIGQGLFSTLLDRQNPDSVVNRWYRLQNLFHEAHHSDGNASTLGFPHVICPEGHKYYNKLACDRSGNGPYAVGAMLMKQARLTCIKQKTCTAGEAELLALAALDARSRILNDNFVDPRPEGLAYRAEPEHGVSGGPGSGI